jgi:hypothetical protein
MMIWRPHSPCRSGLGVQVARAYLASSGQESAVVAGINAAEKILAAPSCARQSKRSPMEGTWIRSPRCFGPRCTD